jgi:pimeloyl-ACP methyl ester carboxylesterase
MATNSGLFIDIVDHRLPWLLESETIIFHHGIGTSHGLWSSWLPSLIPYYRIVRFDMRGFGRSAAAADGFGWNLDNLVGDVIDVANFSDAAQFHLVGESMGGTVALACALDHPDRVRSLTISNGAHIGTSIRNVESWRKVLETTGGAGWSKMMMPDRFFEDALPADHRAWFERDQASQPPQSIIDALSVLVGTDLGSRLSELKRPTLLLHGDSSPFIPVTVMAELHAALPLSEMKVFPHARHGLPFSHGAECAETLLSFLERKRTASASL